MCGSNNATAQHIKRSDSMIEIIKERGGYKYDEFGRGRTGAEVNISDIMSYLIKEVGEKVTNYQSDLYYDLKNLETMVNEWKPNTPEYYYEAEDIYVGLRESGVDGRTFVICRAINSNSVNEFIDSYIDLYRIWLEEDKDKLGVTIQLDKLEKADMVAMYKLINTVKENF